MHDEETPTAGTGQQMGDPADDATVFAHAATASDDGPLKPGQPFGARYHVIRTLGVGGMGAVYQAWDSELGVAVAIKVIRPEVMADPTAAAEVERRFKRELLLARQVTHKNVVRIHDLGEINGIKYITMSYVDGADLASMLKRDGRLAVPAVLRIARPVVSGLVEAHKAGIVHRDLKPANIMIDKSGEALIMDFGIARSSGGAADAAVVAPAGVRKGVAADATRYGAIVGTIQYMAPEQARGMEVDQRADIYALGLMLYDMLAGREQRANTATSALEELSARMEQAPPSIKSFVPEIPEALDQLISRCIEPDPAKRYQTTAELAADLDRLDENGVLIPVKRVVGMRLASAIGVLLIALAGGAWWYARTLVPEAPHATVTVLIADFDNSTNDPSFNHTLEPVMKRGLDDAGFINAYERNTMLAGVGVRPPQKLDEQAARELAAKQGLGVVVSGSINRQGSGYEVAVKAAQTVTGNVLAAAKSRAASKEQVVKSATRLIATVRKALGDKTSESAQMFAMTNVSASSLEVLQNYAAAQEAGTNNRFEEAREKMLKAVELDPKFGVGYQLLAVYSRNLGNVQDAEKYAKEGLKYLDGMTERERFATRGMYYRMTGDYQQCVKEYGDLVARYAGDAVAHNQRALCLSKLHDLRGAVDEMREAVRVLPNRLTFRDNLILYSAYAGDFDGAVREVRAMEQPDAYATLALGLSQLGQGQVKDATETFRHLSTLQGNLGGSFAASALADVALYEGRFADAARAFDEGAAADLARKGADKAATKFASAAYAHSAAGRQKQAVADAENALQNGKAVPIRVVAARVFVEAGLAEKARALAASLSAEFSAEAQAYGKIVEADLALKAGDARTAIKLLNDANGLLDTWLGHFDLGRAYLAAEMFPQADSQFDRCIKRRGEALSLFLDEEPTYGFFPPVHYYQGRVREALGNAGFADSYRAYLASRGSSTEDPLLPEIRRRAGQR